MGALKENFLDIYLTTFSGVRNFEKKSAMRSSFFIKVSKFNADFENAKKNLEKAFCFWDDFVRIVCVKLSLLRRDYFSSAINVLKNSYEAFRLTKIVFFRLNYLPNDQ